jgi:hypothetical protein
MNNQNPVLVFLPVLDIVFSKLQVVYPHETFYILRRGFKGYFNYA